jgi:hypothetical protein
MNTRMKFERTPRARIGMSFCKKPKLTSRPYSMLETVKRADMVKEVRKKSVDELNRVSK